ncbi:YifB family Mg chelatase-like AAA ATPase [Cellvibrio japonicus]|nr:YifB family Mg chelatase-like AAA ATPase [Cellvibrio japonicus]QEI13633.1 YifB family Mg chelatase-like AAA ATPase [Cellvibrio japonicus]QEI17206.1 YifB family Mg chelatase-like AAA ATPase [Cellvibrio japonicus]QEI20784.1 YifB family Mg chelatase-like AAA ATPase [Cellvibrio japonicus]
MSLAIIFSRAKLGINAPQVTVEVHLSNGLPGLSIVGLPETAVKESKDRVRSAILNSHLEFPARRITVNLAPADLPKDGGRFDLPIALGILAASGQIPREPLANYEFLGELALSGELRSLNAALPAALACGDAKRDLIISTANAQEAALSSITRVFGAENLLQVCAHLHGREHLFQATPPASPERLAPKLDIRDVKGQWQAKRALEIAASGGHNLLLYGPPGTGKTMLASRLPGILPSLSEREMLDVAAIYSVAAQQPDHNMHLRPFRAPHHTASAIALVGGGSYPRPGEISLAHGGVLFLDELPEFSRHVLEVLREPLESGEVRISRARAQASYPARFQLVAAMNPCPCGYQGSDQRPCRCSPDQIRRYRDRISGPLLDRIDMHVLVTALRQGEMHAHASGDSSADIRTRVEQTRSRQLARQGKTNSQLSAPELEQVCYLKETDRQLLDQAINKLGLSTRAYHRVLKLARTLADMAGREQLTTGDITEALSYRTLDRARA